jgi:predicted extracellular nuclease
VSGRVVEFSGTTQIDVTGSGSVTIISNSNTLPTSTSLTLPALAGTDMEATYENVENMLITYATDLVVSEYFNLARYGELVLNANNRARQFTDNNEPNVGGYAAYLSQLESSRIILDDDNNIQNSNISGSIDEPYFWPLPGLSNTNFIRGGDQISNLTGIMHWSFAGQNGTDAWRIRPVVNEFTYVFTSVNPRISSPENVGGSLKVASFNVLNYFTTLNERGANSPAELDRQREKIAAAICGLNADIVGLIEIENNGTVAINDLLNGSNGINTLCGSTYAALNTGVIGTDQIAVAFIYNTATVSLEGAFAVLDSSVDPRFDDNRNRPALAQTFRQISNQGQLTVVVNHLKSKGSSCASDGDPDLNDGAANCNLTRAQAAAALVDWLATDPTSSGDPDYLIIGDLNSYKNEDPIDNILLGSDDTSGSTDDYNNLIDDYQGVNGYSYLFDGQLGYLDYALATGSLSGQITGTTVWHVNADEIALFDYNDDIQDTGEAAFQRESSALPIYEVNAFRASDHDPVLVGIDLISSTASTDGASFENSVILFPNPAIKSVTLLNRSNTRLKRATITDLSGKTIHEIDLTDVAIEKQLDISQLAPGLYFITIEGVQGMITKRLIKQ